MVGEARHSIAQQLFEIVGEGEEGEEEEEDEDDEEEDTEGEGMEVHHSESSLVSETEPQSLSELERVGGSSSSLSSGRMEETSLVSERSISGGRTEQSAAFEEIGLSSQAPIAGTASSATVEAHAVEPLIGQRIELLHASLRRLEESSVDPDPEESQLSSDSSNGTRRPPANTSSDGASSRTSGYSIGSSSGAGTRGTSSGQAQVVQHQQQQDSGDGSTSPTRTTGE